MRKAAKIQSYFEGRAVRCGPFGQHAFGCRRLVANLKADRQARHWDRIWVVLKFGDGSAAFIAC